ncbi:hypothetical protein KY284_020084 [Solanum tuberosum]|nr:hypothetical protein KY284_020084 [Solanum tuberosum]
MFKHSPYIVHCFGANVSFEDNVNPYNLLLEYASRGSLADRLQNCNSLPEFGVKKHTKNVLLGLSFINNKGIIHSDIKPGNILLVGRDKIAKIVEFGLSVTLEQGMNQKQGVFRGTERLMAPESVINTEYCPQVDIWNSSKLANTEKTRKKKSDSMPLLDRWMDGWMDRLIDKSTDQQIDRSTVLDRSTD